MLKFFKKAFRKEEIEPPTRNQLKLSKNLGLVIEPSMSKDDVSSLLDRSLSTEPYKSRYQSIQDNKNRGGEDAMREEYGDGLYKKYKEWELLCDGRIKYDMHFKRGSKIISDVVELASVDVIGERKYKLQLSINLPIVHRDTDGECIEWEKEVLINPDQILRMEKREDTIDPEEVDKYHTAKNYLIGLASQYDA